MKWKEYVSLSARTVSGIERADTLEHAEMGYFTERGEFIDQYKKHIAHGRSLDKQNLFEELGDMCWYLALADRQGALIVDYVAKVLDDERELINMFIHNGMDACSLQDVRSACAFLGFDFENVLEANIRKLQVRYPDKFEDVIVRDVKAEMQAIGDVE